VFICFH
jgi:pancreatic triacylglycerol lipase